MRDNFYHWLAVALACAVFFGAALARAADGTIEVFNIIASGVVCLLATACTIKRYLKDTTAGTTHG